MMAVDGEYDIFSERLWPTPALDSMKLEVADATLYAGPPEGGVCELSVITDDSHVNGGVNGTTIDGLWSALQRWRRIAVCCLIEGEDE